VYGVKDVGERKSDGRATGIELDSVLRGRKRETANQEDEKSSFHKVRSQATRRRRPKGNMDCRIKSAVVASPTCIASCASNIRDSEKSTDPVLRRRSESALKKPLARMLMALNISDAGAEYQVPRKRRR
jgi:hypothetical protein